MRFKTHGILKGQNRVRITTVFQDCGHEFAYEGDPADAVQRIKASGGTIGSSGITRCKDCSQAWISQVADALKTMGKPP